MKQIKQIALTLMVVCLTYATTPATFSQQHFSTNAEVTQCFELESWLYWTGLWFINSDDCIKETLYLDENTETDQSVAANPPTTPYYLSSVQTGKGTVKLNWMDLLSATGYKVYEYNSSTDTYRYIKSVTPGTAKSTTLTGVTDGTHYYAISAYNSAGESGKSAHTYIHVSTTGTPSGVTVTETSPKVVNVSWNPVWPVLSYNLYERTGSSWTLIYSGRSTSYTLGVSAGTHTYAVSAVDKYEGPKSNTVSITIR